MKNKASLTCFILFSCCTLVFSQTSQDVIPPSPATREFAKYITHEVSLFNGIPEISIPLYNIQLKGLTIPINLSYHASGIKYAQESGSAGVGWVLNPGYRVSRTIYGYADDLETMPADFAATMSNYQYQRIERDRYLSKFVPGTSFNYGSRLDGEYDQFTFSTPTTGGGFIITDRANKTIATTEESNLLIDYTTGQSACPLIQGIKGLQIVDAQGNKCTFGEYATQSQCNLETASSYYAGTVATAWGITKVTTPTGDEVNFTYERRGAGEFTTHMRTFNVSEGGAPGNCVVQTITDENISTGHGYYTFYPDEIISPHETVSFTYNPNGTVSKIDINSSKGVRIRTIKFFYSTSYYNQSNVTHTFLDRITIQDGDQIDVETYRFEYHERNTTLNLTHDHFGNYRVNLYGENRFYHQEFLDDPVVASPANNCSQQTMNFYMEGLTTSREPDPSSTPNFFSLKKITYPTGGYTEYEYENARYIDGGADAPVRNAGIRIRMITSFDQNSPQPMEKRYAYGVDESGYGVPQAWVLNPEQLFVTERVHARETFPNVLMQRMITYSSGMQGDVGTIYNQSGFVKYPCVTEYYSEGNVSPVGGMGKTVYYFDVGHLFDMRPLATRVFTSGWTYTATPYYVYRYRLWDRPVLTRKVAYKYSGTQYDPVQEEILDYQQTSTTYTGVKVEQFVTNNTGTIDQWSYGENFAQLEGYFNYDEYSVVVGKNFLTHKTQHQYTNGNTITTEYDYEYSNLLVSKEAISRSTGDKVVIYTSYPQDYATGTGFINDMMTNHLLSYPIEQVKYLDNGTDQKILSGKITKYKAGGKGLKDEELVLETSSPLLLSTFKFSNRTTGFLPPQGTPQAFSADGHYKLRLSYNAYDSKGNPLRMTQQDGLTTSYLWGYDQTYPIAKVDNAIYDGTGVGAGTFSRVNEVFYENFEEHPQRTAIVFPHSGRHIYQGVFNVELRDKIAGDYILTYWSSTNSGLDWTRHDVEITVNTSSTGYTIGSAVTLLDDVRLHPRDAQMSTYTYDPLKGMTSETNPAGVTLLYEYDAYGRLMFVKDHKRNILKHIKYNYKD